MIFQKSLRLFHTLRHLKPIQVFYQLKYRLVKPGTLQPVRPVAKPTPLNLPDYKPASILEVTPEKDYVFHMLNRKQVFSGQINWGESAHGRLWNYHLQYADFLKQENIPENERAVLVKDLYRSLSEGHLALEPYPASLRIQNMVRFLSHDAGRVDRWQDLLPFVYGEVKFLSNRLEYHLLANHLLENAFALLMGACFFGDRKIKTKALDLLSSQLKEQILEDGGHFERSPMYHRIVLFRVLEAISYVPKEAALYKQLRDCAKSMISWMQAMRFRNGAMPHFNDSTHGVAPDVDTLLQMAADLGLWGNKVVSEAPALLKESGFRKLTNHRMELIADVYGIGPSYQPGHAHADTFSFELHVDETPIIVDPGISTYEKGDRRNWERSTRAHNTVTVNGSNSSDVWASHRVGKRAEATILEDKTNSIKASHNGYQHIGITHLRSFSLSEKSLVIEDALEGKMLPSVARFYLHPNVPVQHADTAGLILNHSLSLSFEGASDVRVQDYQYACGFNCLEPAKVIEVKFTESLKTTISL